jgi:1,4-dihydroxy-2-naphthoate octaprenyltransferase
MRRHPYRPTLFSMVFELPTVTAAIFTVAVIFMGIAVPIALIVPIAALLAVRVVTAVTPVRADHTGRQSKDTCDRDVASYTIEGIHRQSPRGQRSG